MKSWTRETLDDLDIIRCPQNEQFGCSTRAGITIYIHTSGEYYPKLHCDNCGFTWDLIAPKKPIVRKGSVMAITETDSMLKGLEHYENKSTWQTCEECGAQVPIKAGVKWICGRCSTVNEVK